MVLIKDQKCLTTLWLLQQEMRNNLFLIKQRLLQKRQPRKEETVIFLYQHLLHKMAVLN